MITVAKNNLEKFEKNISGDSFLSRKLHREYLSNRDVDLNNFYTMDSCAIMLMGENMSLRGNPSEDDIDSILSFCHFMGVYGLETEIDNLPIKTKTTMRIMEYGEEKKSPADDIEKNTNIYSFAEFCASNFSGASFSYIYPFFARKVNKGISDIYFITDKGKIVSGAAATKYKDDEVYLTFVSTRKNYRKKGLAKKIIDHIAAENKDKKVILMCEDELVPFYEKLNFTHKGDIYLYTLREEHI